MNSEYSEKFNELVKDQFVYGGKKYALREGRESTDELFDDFSEGWLLGTMAKYCKRWTNLKRERDLLKIACYCFISFLKRGFHLYSNGSYLVIDTDVELKTRMWSEFLACVREYDMHVPVKELTINDIYNVLKGLFNKGWFNISQDDLVHVYLCIFKLWLSNYSQTTQHDTDTYGEQSK